MRRKETLCKEFNFESIKDLYDVISYVMLDTVNFDTGDKICVLYYNSENSKSNS